MLVANSSKRHFPLRLALFSRMPDPFPCVTDTLLSFTALGLIFAALNLLIHLMCTSETVPLRSRRSPDVSTPLNPWGTALAASHHATGPIIQQQGETAGITSFCTPAESDKTPVAPSELKTQRRCPQLDTRHSAEWLPSGPPVAAEGVARTCTMCESPSYWRV